MKFLEDLDGVSVARAEANEDGVVLQLLAPSGMVDGKYFPAESFTITSLDAARKLNEILTRVLAHHDSVAAVEEGVPS
jgi:hypothetical protein